MRIMSEYASEHIYERSVDEPRRGVSAAPANYDGDLNGWRVLRFFPFFFGTVACVVQ